MFLLYFPVCVRTGSGAAQRSCVMVCAAPWGRGITSHLMALSTPFLAYANMSWFRYKAKRSTESPTPDCCVSWFLVNLYWFVCFLLLSYEKDMCHADEGSFRVLVENEACGIVGHRCAKAVTIFYHGGLIVMQDGEVTHKESKLLILLTYSII